MSYEVSNDIITTAEIEHATKNLVGRPQKDLPIKILFELAKIHCTVKEIAAVLDCSHELIYDRYSDVLQRGQQFGQMSLKRKMHELAMNGDSKMLIWLSKQRLGYKENYPETATQMVFNVQVNEMPK